MTGVFRTAVDGIVLGAGPEFTVLGILRPLQALHYLHTHDTCQVGILAVGPYRETAHLHVLTLQVVHAVVVLGTEFGTGDVENLI